MRRKQKLIANPQSAGLNPAGENPAVVHPINVLDWKTQGLVRECFGRLQLVDCPEEIWAIEPSEGRLRVLRHIRAGARGNRDEGARAYSELLQERAEFRFDRA